MDISTITVEGNPSRRLPDYVREAGYFLNMECLKIGDFFLTTPINPTGITLAIREAQSEGHDSHHSNWTHVAIYIGDGLSCEATLKGVIIKDIYDHLKFSKIKIIRCSKLTDHQRYLCAIKALQRLRKPYSYGEIVSQKLEGFKAAFSRIKTGAFKQSLNGAFTCSGLAYDVFLEAAQSPPFPDLVRPAPADFSAAATFKPVPISWLRLPQH